MGAGDIATSKADARRQVLVARRSMSGTDRTLAAASITRALLALPEMGSVTCVAAYLSFGTEPSTTAVLESMDSSGVRVLLPVLRPDRDLDWAIYDPDRAHPQARPGPWAPSGELLGVDAVAAADVVVVPALAVGRDGTRLGRGGGSYDRALARVPSGRPVVALLYAGELVPAVPSEPHDRTVTLAVLPDGPHRLPDTDPAPA